MIVRLIVTRPEADAAALALHLEAAGHNVILAPLLSIRPVDNWRCQSGTTRQS
jgi:uroporphyrinogen-III synthase